VSEDGIHKGPKVGKIFARNDELRAKKPPQRGHRIFAVVELIMCTSRPRDAVYLADRVFGLTRRPAVPGPAGGGSTFFELPELTR
jgi:hypothetical protein